jgi:hypothetical protein
MTRDMALPTDRATAAEPVVSALRDGIPSAEPPLKPLWLDQRRKQLRWEVDNGPVILEYPRVFTPNEIDDFEAVTTLFIAGLRRIAQAIEARRAETERLGRNDESAVRKDAPVTSPERQSHD